MAQLDHLRCPSPMGTPMAGVRLSIFGAMMLIALAFVPRTLASLDRGHLHDGGGMSGAQCIGAIGARSV